MASRGAPVPRRVIERALEAANWAPTHGKTEPWRFAVFMGEAPLARFHAIKRAATERSLKSKPVRQPDRPVALPRPPSSILLPASCFLLPASFFLLPASPRPLYCRRLDP